MEKDYELLVISVHSLFIRSNIKLEVRFMLEKVILR
ncbi:hypothetical protein SATMO3_37030 [Sporomusa aerivorans]